MDFEITVEELDLKAEIENPKAFKENQIKIFSQHERAQKNLEVFKMLKTNDIGIRYVAFDLNPSVERVDYAAEISRKR